MADPLQELREAINDSDTAYGAYLQSLPADERQEVIDDFIRFVDERTFRGEVISEYTIAEGEVKNWLNKSDIQNFNDYCFEYLYEPSSLYLEFCDKFQEMVEQSAAYHDTSLKENTFDTLYDTVSDIISEDLSYRLEYPLHVNLVLGSTEDVYSFSDWCEGRATPTEKDLADNSIVWLLHQQGYTLDDYVRGVDSPFLNSLREECDNSTTYGQIAICCSADSLDAVQALKGSDNIAIPKGATLGLYDPVNGGGSLMSIVLEQDIVVPRDMISRTEVEEKYSSRAMTVDKVFGLVGKAWENTPLIETKAQPKPVDTQADLETLSMNAQQGMGM